MVEFTLKGGENMEKNLTTDFFENNEQALREQGIVLRDSLGVLAIHILEAREDIANMEYDEMLRKLYKIITDLHNTYHHMNYYFE